MSRLSDFLNPVQEGETKEVIVSKRFRGEDGNPAPFVIRSISQSENEKLTAAATRRVRRNGKVETTLDAIDYSKRLVLAAVVEPDLRDAELARRYGCIDAADVASNMLLVGEYAKLIDAITAFSGLDDAETMEEEAKN